MTIVLTILTGMVYPGVVTGLCQLFFKKQADGSLIVKDGHVVGSALIGQNFTRPEYFQPRLSAAGNDGYDPMASGGSNLGPTSKKLADRVKASVETFRKQDPEFTGPIPPDLLTTSASGLDPDLSPPSATAQIPRVAKARGASEQEIGHLVAQFTVDRDLGFLGEPRVNVLLLNLALDEHFPLTK